MEKTTIEVPSEVRAQTHVETALDYLEKAWRVTRSDSVGSQLIEGTGCLRRALMLLRQINE